MGRPGEKTYNKCGELLFVCSGEIHHGIEDLNAGIGVDIDAVLIWRAGSGRVSGCTINPVIGGDIRFSQGCVNGRRANLDGHGRIEGSHSHLEGLKTDVFVGENAKFSGFVYADGDTAGQAVFVGTKPGVALGLLEDVMQNGIISVVIHSGSH